MPVVSVIDHGYYVIETLHIYFTTEHAKYDYKAYTLQHVL